MLTADRCLQNAELAWMVRLEAEGKAYYSINEVKQAEWSDAWISWVLGAFLLGKQPGSALWLGTVGVRQGYGNWSVLAPAAMSAPIGSPLGPHATTEDGLMLRNFSNGLICLNPTGGYPDPQDNRTLRIALGVGRYYDAVAGKAWPLPGLGPDGVLTLAPQTARVLLFSSAPKLKTDDVLLPTLALALALMAPTAETVDDGSAFTPDDPEAVLRYPAANAPELAAFLIVRGEYSYYGHGWIASKPPVWYPEWDWDVGTLQSSMRRNGATFSRRWSKGMMSLDCATFEASFGGIDRPLKSDDALKTDDIEQGDVAGGALDGCDLATFRVSVVRPSGALEVGLCGDTFSVESHFSKPPKAGAPAGWNSFGGDRTGGAGGWTVAVSQVNATSWVVQAQSSLYSIVRTISLAPDGHTRLLVDDTITNLQADAPLGLAFQNEITVNGGGRRRECTPRPWCKHYTNQLSPCIHVGGLRNELNISWSNSYTATNPAWNPTTMIEGQAGAGGLGLAVLDERWRLQLDMSAATNFTAKLDNRGLGLPPAGSHAYRWAIYPVPSREIAANGTGGYWDFINRVRSDYVPATTLRRLGGWLDWLRATEWSKERLASWLAVRGFKHIIIDGPYGGEPWLGENTNWSWYPSVTKGVPVNNSRMLRMLGQACRNLQAIEPEMQCAPAFETAMSPGLTPGDTKVKWKDSICIQPDGQPAGYRWTGCQSAADPSPACQKWIATHGHQYLYYPVESPPNSYYAFIQKQFSKAFDVANLTSGYMDIFSYAAGTGGPQLHSDHDRWTYDRCDGHSVDLHPNYTIARCKTELSHLTAPARAAVAKAILSRSAESMVVVNDMGVADAIRELPIHHFLEAVYDTGYTQAHFSTPLALGYSPGYKAGLVEIGKAGTWWQTWNSDRDVFEDVKDKLKSGVLYYAYDLPEYNLTTTTGNGILSFMFPITPRELYEGCVVGDERVITLHNGSYSFGGTAAAAESAATAAAVCVCFDDGGQRVGRTVDGREPEPVPATTTRRRVHEKQVAQHSCVVPRDGACVLMPATVPLKSDDEHKQTSPLPPRLVAPASTALRVRSWSNHTCHYAVGDTWPCTSLASGRQLCVAGDITLASPNGTANASCPGTPPLHDSGMSAWKVQGTPDPVFGYSGSLSIERVSGYCSFSPQRFCRGTSPASAQTKPSTPLELNGTLYLGVSCITYCFTPVNPDRFRRQTNLEGYIATSNGECASETRPS